MAELEVIKERYPEFEIIGPPEIRDATVGSFNPHRRSDDERDKDEER